MTLAVARRRAIGRLPILPLCLVAATACSASGRGAATGARDFPELVASLSEPGAYFDTDNLISNETSYLHVVDAIEDAGIRGGAYLGVGPGQNFSYIAAIRPTIALIVDIRRDNLLEHLLFKALFAAADSRIEYLCLLLGRPFPRGADAWRDSSLAALVGYIDTVTVRPEQQRAAVDTVTALTEQFGVPLSDEDRTTIGRFHAAFMSAGLDLRFHSHGRPPRPYYPTLRRLLLETDRQGRQVSYLASEQRWRIVDELQDRDRVIPVVGDLAGDHALRAIANLLHDDGVTVSAFYTSNVEFYLMGDGTFDRYAANVVRLPIDEQSVMIRSFFGRNFGYLHPDAVPGSYSVQLMQRMQDFVGDIAAGGYRSYLDLVMQEAPVSP